MQAIRTRYHGPTNYKGSRISAKCEARTIYLSYDHALNGDENHRKAARQRRELLDRSKPFVCYVDSDGARVTGWKGNLLGVIVSWNRFPLTRKSYIHGNFIFSYVVRDVHGGYWYGRGNPGICITLRPYKAKKGHAA